jgi:integrase/recombinase XerD
VARLPLHNAVRVDEACAVGIADLGENCGHRVIGDPPGRPEGEDPAHRGYRGGSGCLPGRPGSQSRGARLAAPLLATASGRLRQGRFRELVRCLARTAGIGAWEQPSPHCLHHSAITFTSWTPVPPRATSRITPAAKTPRTTRRHDHSRDSLDRNAAYTVAAYLAQQHCRAPRLGASTSSQPCGRHSGNLGRNFADEFVK